jgi:hypothetical protein
MGIMSSVVTKPEMLSTCPEVTQTNMHGNDGRISNCDKNIGQELGKHLPVNEFK